MSVVWLTCSFNLYLLVFLMNSFKQIYLTSTCLSLGSITAYATSGCIFIGLGVKKSLIFGLAQTLVSGFVILVIGLKHQEAWYFPCLIMSAKIGLSLSLGLCYHTNSQLFPTLFAARALGICNILARSFTAMSSLMAKLEEPFPMILFTVAAFLTLILIPCLDVPESGNPEELLVQIKTAD